MRGIQRKVIIAITIMKILIRILVRTISTVIIEMTICICSNSDDNNNSANRNNGNNSKNNEQSMQSRNCVASGLQRSWKPSRACCVLRDLSPARLQILA